MEVKPENVQLISRVEHVLETPIRKMDVEVKKKVEKRSSKTFAKIKHRQSPEYV
jgi:hypothetical protein